MPYKSKKKPAIKARKRIARSTDAVDLLEAATLNGSDGSLEESNEPLDNIPPIEDHVSVSERAARIEEGFLRHGFRSLIDELD